MEDRIIIAGHGGQGILFLGRLIVYSAMIAGREVTWFPSYGAEMRGGTANCTVVIADEMIGSPVIRNPDCLILMNEASCRRFSSLLLPNGLLIYDSSLIGDKEISSGLNAIGIPASDIAAYLNASSSANMAIAGAFIGATKIVDIDSAVRAVERITPAHRKDFIKLNKDLILRGYNYISEKGNYMIA